MFKVFRCFVADATQVPLLQRSEGEMPSSMIRSRPLLLCPPAVGYGSILTTTFRIFTENSRTAQRCPFFFSDTKRRTEDQRPNG